MERVVKSVETESRKALGGGGGAARGVGSCYVQGTGLPFDKMERVLWMC